MSEETPRLLVEGGLVHQRINRILAVLIGIVLGLTVGLTIMTIYALNGSSVANSAAHQSQQTSHQAQIAVHEAQLAINTVKASRVLAIRRSCEEADEHHEIAQKGLEALAKSTAPKNPTPKELQQRQVILDAFVNALAPYYNCETRVKEYTKP